MLSTKNTPKLLFVLSLLTLSFFGQSKQAYADWGRHHGHEYRHHHGYPYGRIDIGLPHGSLRIGFGGGGYYYGNGFFYRQRERDYVVVPAPIGAVVYTVPSGYHEVMIDRTTYYTYEGVYYRRVPQGYQVVEPPQTVIVEPATVTATVPTNSTQDEFTVNIPNSQGGYTAVKLKRSGNGFTGPQGEFYSEFPKVDQLRTMYVK